MLLEAMLKLHAARGLLPGLDTPLGGEILIWLLKARERPRPLMDLYNSSRFSEPTVRTLLMRLVDQGFVAFHSDDADQRNRFAKPTPKLVAAVEGYLSLVVKAAALAAEELPYAKPSTASRPAGANVMRAVEVANAPSKNLGSEATLPN